MWLTTLIFALALIVFLFFVLIFFTVNIGPRESCLLKSSTPSLASSLLGWKRWSARIDDMREYFYANPM